MRTKCSLHNLVMEDEAAYAQHIAEAHDGNQITVIMLDLGAES